MKVVENIDIRGIYHASILKDVGDFRVGQSFICSEGAVWLLEKLRGSFLGPFAVVTRMGGKLLDAPGLGEVQVLHTRMPE